MELDIVFVIKDGEELTGIRNEFKICSFFRKMRRGKIF